MAYCTDDNLTPRPCRVVISDEWAERSPYIPRRKSSHNEGPTQGTSTTSVTRLSRAEQDTNVPQDGSVQKARFPIDGYDPPSGQALHQIPLQRGPELRRPQSALKQSSSRRFLSRMFSNLPFPSNVSRPQPTHSNASHSKLGRTHCRSVSKTSSRASSTLSVSTAPPSSPENTVRRRRQLAVTSIRSVISDSPNPLRAPPPSLLGPPQDNSTVSEATESISSIAEGSAESLDVPTVAYGQLQSLTFTGHDRSKNGSPRCVWVILDLLCSLHQPADREPLSQEQRPKSFNNPGLLRAVTLSLSALQNCQIVTILGQCTTATLSPEQTLTAIVLVTLHKSLLPSTRPSPQKENGRVAASSERRRPTSDVLSDELLNQLLGKFKRTSQARGEKMDERILRAIVTYEHSLFPPKHEIRHEETVSVKRAAVCYSQHGSLQERKQRQDHDSPHLSMAKNLSGHDTQNAAERIIRLLREGLRSDGNAEDVPLHPTIDPGQAVKLLNDFLAAATRLPPSTSRTLEMLKFRYSMLVNEDPRVVAPAESAPSPKRHNPFDRRKHERRKSFEPESPVRTPHTAAFTCGRRDAFEIDRDEMSIDQGLADITNRTRRPSHDPLAGIAHVIEYDETTDLGRHEAIPAPLFSPRRGPPLMPFSGMDPTGNGSVGRLGKNDFYGCRQQPRTNIGSANFYAAEVEQMARQAFGGSATSCHHRSEFSHKPIGNDESDRGHDHPGEEEEEEEEDGNDRAKMIWERMRISSEASGTSAKSTEVRYSDESADEAEMVRECKVLGAPWLA